MTFFCSLDLAEKVFLLENLSDRILGAFLTGSVVIVLTSQLLSLFNHLNYFFAFFVIVLIDLAIDLIVFDKPTLAAVNSDNNVSVPNEPARSKFLESGIFIFIFCALVVLLLNFAMALVMPPAPSDAFLDHLVFPAEWIKAGRIFFVQTLSPEQATTYYPGNAELIYAWLMTPLHNDLLAGGLECLSLIAAGLAVVRICTRLGIERNVSIAATLLGAAAPGVVVLTRKFGVDLFYTAAFLAAVAFLIPDREGRVNAGEIVLAGLAAGLAVGTKYVGVLFSVMLVPLLFAPKKGVAPLRRFALFFVALFVACGYWYIRNIIATGSPFYPLGVKLFGFEIFKGAYSRTAMFNSYLHIPTSDKSYFLNILTSLVYGKYLLISIGALLIVSIAINSKRFFKTEWWKHYLFVLPFIIVISYWFFNPYNTANNYRFMAPAVFLFGIPIAALMEKRIRHEWLRIISNLVWLLLAVCIVISNYDEISMMSKFFYSAAAEFNTDPWRRLALETSVASFFFILSLAAVAYFAYKKRNKFIAVAAIAMVVGFFALTATKYNFLNSGRYAWYSSHYLGAGWQFLSNVKQPVTIAYSGNCSPYGLYGENLKNKIKYVNVDGREDAVFHDYEIESRRLPGYSPPADSCNLNGIFRNRPNYEKWLASLKSHRADILFVSREFYRGIISDPIELIWATSHPETFSLVFHRNDIFIFQVK